MKIALTNKTHYRDDHIREFVKRGIREEREDLCRRGAPPMRVEFVYKRRQTESVRGLGGVRRNWIRIYVCKNVPADRTDLAMVIAHELAHTRGMRDEHIMRNSARYGRVGSWREIYGWAETLPLEIAPKPCRTKPSTDVKLQHCQNMLRAAMTREKKAKTIRAKWQKKIAYYTKKAALTQSRQPPYPGNQDIETGDQEAV